MSVDYAENTGVELDDVLKTGELAGRVTRPPQHAAESTALLGLANAMLDVPSAILQRLVDSAQLLCRSESAGISVLEDSGDGPVFRWRAVGGKLAHIAGGSIPRDESPCGIVVQRNAAQMFVEPGRYFPLVAAVKPAFREILLAPFHDAGRPVGTVWVMQHSFREYDAEDLRLLISLATFASAAHKLSVRTAELEAANESRMREIGQRKRMEVELRMAHSELEVRVRERTEDLAMANCTLRQEISDRKLAEESRRQLLRRLVTAEEEERRRIARELHDHMGQLSAALSLGLKSIENEVCQGKQHQLKSLHEIANQIGREVHDLALELRPAALDDLGLHAALTNYLETWSDRTGIPAEFHSRGLDGRRLPANIETIFYRVAQEGLTNALKHSEASRLCVILEVHSEEVRLVIEDDGVGFDVEQVLYSSQVRRRLGLVGMQERLAAIDGLLQIESTPGKGTTLIGSATVNAASPIQSNG